MEEPRRGEHPKICDFVYAQGTECILIDANNRNMPKKFAERSAAGIDLRKKIQDMFAATKFEQLISTGRQFIARGWTKDGATIVGAFTAAAAAFTAAAFTAARAGFRGAGVRGAGASTGNRQPDQM